MLLIIPLIFFIPIEVVANVNMGSEFGESFWNFYCEMGIILLLIDMLV